MQPASPEVQTCPKCGGVLEKTPTGGASVKDGANNTVTSKFYYRSGVVAFRQGFLPIIEHWDGDTLPVPPPPNCPCEQLSTASNQSCTREIIVRGGSNLCPSLTIYRSTAKKLRPQRW
jgi:hypothetical protein